MAAEFDRVWRDPAHARNTVLVASDGPLGAQRLGAAAAEVPPDLAPVIRAAASRLEPARTDGTVYTDERAPVEWLIDVALLNVAVSGEG